MLQRNETKKVHAHELRRIAVAAECDPRTVSRYLVGSAVLPLVRRRIERAIQNLDGQPAAAGIRVNRSTAELIRLKLDDESGR